MRFTHLFVSCFPLYFSDPSAVLSKVIFLLLKAHSLEFLSVWVCGDKVFPPLLEWHVPLFVTVEVAHCLFSTPSLRTLLCLQASFLISLETQWSVFGLFEESPFFLLWLLSLSLFCSGEAIFYSPCLRLPGLPKSVDWSLSSVREIISLQLLLLPPLSHFSLSGI